ncbi:MAG TPA: DUF1573 domain-containing protein [Isosphaeraceae bacterium]|nr:DUF1573 domain-containing protein [Isosphaeraceae bacterium]
MSVATAGLVLLVLSAWALYAFGSISMALDFVAGERLLVDEHRKSFGSLASGQSSSLEFTVNNMTGHTVRIIGCQSKCTCTMAQGLPMSIPSSERRVVRILIHALPRPGEVAEALWLYTDDRGRPQIIINVTGRFTEDNKKQPLKGHDI